MSTIKNFAQEFYNDWRQETRRAYSKRNYHGHKHVFDPKDAPGVKVEVTVFGRQFNFDTNSQPEQSFDDLSASLITTAEEMLKESKYLELDKSKDSFKKFKDAKDKQVNSLKNIKKMRGMLVSYMGSKNDIKIAEIQYGSFARNGVLRSGIKMKPEGLITIADYDSKGLPINHVTQLSPDGSVYQGALKKGLGSSLSSVSDLKVFMPNRLYMSGNLSEGVLRKAEFYNQQQIKESGEFQAGFLNGEGRKFFPDKTTVAGVWHNGIADGDFTFSFHNGIKIKTKISPEWIAGKQFEECGKRSNDELAVEVDYGNGSSYKGNIALKSEHLSDWFKSHYKDDLIVFRDLGFAGKGVFTHHRDKFLISWDDNNLLESVSLLDANGEDSTMLFMPQDFSLVNQYDPKEFKLNILMSNYYTQQLEVYKQAKTKIDNLWTAKIPEQREVIAFYQKKEAELRQAARDALAEMLNAFGSMRSPQAQHMQHEGRSQSTKFFEKDKRVIAIGVGDSVCTLIALDSRVKKGDMKPPVGKGIEITYEFDDGDPKLPLYTSEAAKFNVDDFMNLGEKLNIFVGEVSIAGAYKEGYRLWDNDICEIDRNNNLLASWSHSGDYTYTEALSSVRIGASKKKAYKLLCLEKGAKMKYTHIHDDGKLIHHGDMVIDVSDKSEVFNVGKITFNQDKAVGKVILHAKDGRLIEIPLKDDSSLDCKNSTIYFKGLSKYQGGITEVVWGDAAEQGAAVLMDKVNFGVLLMADYNPGFRGQGTVSLLRDGFQMAGDWASSEQGEVSLGKRAKITLGPKLKLEVNVKDGFYEDDSAQLTFRDAKGRDKTAKLVVKANLVKDIEDNEIDPGYDERLKQLVQLKLRSFIGVQIL